MQKHSRLNVEYQDNIVTENSKKADFLYNAGLEIQKIVMRFDKNIMLYFENIPYKQP